MRRETGFSHDDRVIVEKRSVGWCEMCNRRPYAHMHHRKPRRMGGRYGASFDDVNRASNALALCSHCHDWAETGNRRAAQNMGVILSEHENPEFTPVFLKRYRGWVLLDDEGEVGWEQSETHARQEGRRREEEKHSE